MRALSILLLTCTAAGCASGDSAQADAGPFPAFAGCTLQSAVPASSVALKEPASYEPACVRLSPGDTLLIQANAMHPLQGMVKNGTTPNPITQGEPPTGYLQDTSFTFPAQGAFGFYCNVHGSDSPNPGAMAGVVYVH